MKIWFQNRRTKWKKHENISNAEAAEHKVGPGGKQVEGAHKNINKTVVAKETAKSAKQPQKLTNGEIDTCVNDIKQEVGGATDVMDGQKQSKVGLVVSGDVGSPITRATPMVTEPGAAGESDTGSMSAPLPELESSSHVRHSPNKHTVSSQDSPHSRGSTPSPPILPQLILAKSESLATAITIHRNTEITTDSSTPVLGLKQIRTTLVVPPDL